MIDDSPTLMDASGDAFSLAPYKLAEDDWVLSRVRLRAGRASIDECGEFLTFFEHQALIAGLRGVRDGGSVFELDAIEPVLSVQAAPDGGLARIAISFSPPAAAQRDRVTMSLVVDAGAISQFCGELEARLARLR